MRPQPGTYPDYYHNYIPLVKQDNLVDALKANETETYNFFKAIPSSKGDFAYEAGKWSIKGVFNHLIDTERIFAYRALRFARKDEKQPLSFEQDEYVPNAEPESRSPESLLDEFSTLRRSNISLFGSFSSEALLRSGITAAGKATVLSIGFTICGHNIHHMNVVKERYLPKM
jgi:uncharacterized damage-inducible protein DinB